MAEACGCGKAPAAASNDVTGKDTSRRDVTDADSGDKTQRGKQNGDVVHAPDPGALSLSSADYSHPYPYR